VRVDKIRKARERTQSMHHPRSKRIRVRRRRIAHDVLEVVELKYAAYDRSPRDQRQRNDCARAPPRKAPRQKARPCEVVQKPKTERTYASCFASSTSKTASDSTGGAGATMDVASRYSSLNTAIAWFGVSIT
jgi:hypothetical protein